MRGTLSILSNNRSYGAAKMGLAGGLLQAYKYGKIKTGINTGCRVILPSI
jgi:hypothetical protein